MSTVITIEALADMMRDPRRAVPLVLRNVRGVPGRVMVITVKPRGEAAECLFLKSLTDTAERGCWTWFKPGELFERVPVPLPGDMPGISEALLRQASEARAGARA